MVLEKTPPKTGINPVMVLFKDTFNHLWDHSRPVIVEMEREIKRRRPQIMICTEI